MEERTGWVRWAGPPAWKSLHVLTDAEVLREILLDENGEPRDGVRHHSVLRTEHEWVPGRGARVKDEEIIFGYFIPAEMLEADDG